tara:strand:- start:596 stop:994 length:399 start_codon:yes stop_codon:yes gene_type:complete
MSFRIIQLENLCVRIEENDNNISLFFNAALIKKTMDDAVEKTLWKQDGSIEVRNIRNKINIGLDTATILGINISYDFYTYKNMLALPFYNKGDIFLSIQFDKIEKILDIECSEIEILLADNPKYIRHIKKME